MVDIALEKGLSSSRMSEMRVVLSEAMTTFSSLRRGKWLLSLSPATCFEVICWTFKLNREDLRKLESCTEEKSSGFAAAGMYSFRDCNLCRRFASSIASLRSLLGSLEMCSTSSQSTMSLPIFFLREALK